MDDDGDLHEQILHTEAHIEELTDIIERCRKIILFSKAAIAAGGILILATVVGAVGFDPTVLIGAIAAVIGGTVVFGSNASTLKQTLTDTKAAEAHRTELISRMDLKVWETGSSRAERGGINRVRTCTRRGACRLCMARPRSASGFPELVDQSAVMYYGPEAFALAMMEIRALGWDLFCLQ
jgi:hypothetical protein